MSRADVYDVRFWLPPALMAGFFLEPSISLGDAALFAPRPIGQHHAHCVGVRRAWACSPHGNGNGFHDDVACRRFVDRSWYYYALMAHGGLGISRCRWAARYPRVANCLSVEAVRLAPIAYALRLPQGTQMKLPRFRIKSLLIVTAVVALWLSTLTGYTGSNDIQAFVWAAIVIMAGVAAMSYTARRRAFWTGFFGTLLLSSMRTVFSVYGANLNWTQKLSTQLTTNWQGDASGRGRMVLNINATLILLVLLVAATVIGFLCVFVYDQSKKTENRESNIT
jgi:hypothetical protein